MIRILQCDDHVLVREGIARILAEQPDMEVVGSVGSGEEALSRLAQLQVDVLLLDLTLPGIPGLEVLRQVRDRFSKLPVLVLSMYPPDQIAAHVVRNGAAGYLPKGSSSSELLAAIRRVAADGVYLTSETIGELVRGPLGEDTAPHQRLSSRERQVYDLLADGVTPSEIANRLGLGASTVGTYVSRVKTKLGLESLGEIVAYAHRHGVHASEPL